MKAVSIVIAAIGGALIAIALLLPMEGEATNPLRFDVNIECQRSFGHKTTCSGSVQEATR